MRDRGCQRAQWCGTLPCTTWTFEKGGVCLCFSAHKRAGIRWSARIILCTRASPQCVCLPAIKNRGVGEARCYKFESRRAVETEVCVSPIGGMIPRPAARREGRERGGKCRGDGGRQDRGGPAQPERTRWSGEARVRLQAQCSPRHGRPRLFAASPSGEMRHRSQCKRCAHTRHRLRFRSVVEVWVYGNEEAREGCVMRAARVRVVLNRRLCPGSVCACLRALPR